MGRDKREKTLTKTKIKYDKNKVQLEKLKEGQKVIVQCQHTKKWTKPATVVSIRRSGHSYNLEDDDGFMCIRNRKFIRVSSDQNIPEDEDEVEEEEGGVPRRSKRLADQCNRVRALEQSTPLQSSSSWAVAAAPQSQRPTQGWSLTTESSMNRVDSTSWRSSSRRPGGGVVQCAASCAVVASDVGSAPRWRTATGTDWHVPCAHPQALDKPRIRVLNGTGMPSTTTTQDTAVKERCTSSTTTGLRKSHPWIRPHHDPGGINRQPWCTSSSLGRTSSLGNRRQRHQCRALRRCEQCAVRAVKKEEINFKDVILRAMQRKNVHV